VRSCARDDEVSVLLDRKAGQAAGDGSVDVARERDPVPRIRQLEISRDRPQYRPAVSDRVPASHLALAGVPVREDARVFRHEREHEPAVQLAGVLSGDACCMCCLRRSVDRGDDGPAHCGCLLVSGEHRCSPARAPPPIGRELYLRAGRDRGRHTCLRAR
jgi:hypothetical protein